MFVGGNVISVKGFSMYNFDYYIPTRVHFGPNKLEKLAEIKLPGKKACIVTTKERFFVDRVVDLLQKNGTGSAVYDKARPNPSNKGVNDCAAFAKENGCDFFLGLGGGSSIDTAKGAAMVFQNGGDLWDYVPYFADAKTPNGAAPIVVVSTTAGTGSEMDPWGVIMNDETKEKLDVFCDELFPQITIIDPVLQTSLPKQLTAAMGLDTLFHAAEDYICSYASPVSEMLDEKVIKLVAANLVRAYENGEDLDARAGMALASMLAGMSECLTMTISLHAMAHTLGAIHNTIPHGIALALAAVPCCKFYEHSLSPRVTRCLVDMSEMVGYGDKPEGFTRFVSDLIEKTGMNDIDPAQYGCDPNRAEEYADHCLRVTPTYFDYEDRVMSAGELAYLFRQALTRK